MLLGEPQRAYRSYTTCAPCFKYYARLSMETSGKFNEIFSEPLSAIIILIYCNFPNSDKTLSESETFVKSQTR